MRGVRERDEEDELEPPPDVPWELEVDVFSKELREEEGGSGGNCGVEEMTAAPAVASIPSSIGEGPRDKWGANGVPMPLTTDR